MISKEAFARVLNENNFEQSAIDRILNKRIKTLLKNGNERKIDNILKVLEKKQIDISKIIDGNIYILLLQKKKVMY